MPIDDRRLDKFFARATLPAVDAGNELNVEEIRHSAKKLAKAIISHSPASSDQSDAVRKTREAMQAAVQAIVCK